MPSLSRLFDRKSVDAAVAQGEASGYRRALGAFDLTSIGVAAIIGTGIFVLLGRVALEDAGPAVILSILVGAVAIVFTALAFAEFASLVPVSGSVYLYAYGSLGRFPAFLIGWTTLNAYTVGNMVVSAGFAEYFQSGLTRLGAAMPTALVHAPGEGGVFNIPAFVIMLVVTGVCLARIRESSAVNNVLVVMKLAVVVLVIALGAMLVDPANWRPFSPFGTSGVMSGAAVLLFAYFGFDTVSAAGSEARNPKRDLPIGILVSVVLCALLYLAMGAVLTGMQRYDTLAEGAPVAEAFRTQGYSWAADIITVGVLIGMTTVLYAFHLAVTRILQAMAVDGFLPVIFARVNKATATPWTVTIVVGVLTAIGAALLPLSTVADMTVVATVTMYVFISGGVLVLKYTHPELPRRFSTHPVFPALAIIALVIIVFTGIPANLHFWFLAWLGLGIMIYGFYSHRSSLRAEERHPATAAGPSHPAAFTRAQPQDAATISYGRSGLRAR